MTWVHWVLYNIPVEVKELTEDAGMSGLPAGTMEGVNDWGRTGYGGPCPPLDAIAIFSSFMPSI
jgi:phosphatidylethanolamine-binding protein (PEBP) family uncharacterized protein